MEIEGIVIEGPGGGGIHREKAWDRRHGAVRAASKQKLITEEDREIWLQQPAVTAVKERQEPGPVDDTVKQRSLRG